MKKELTGIEVKYLVKELQSIVGGRIDKPYHHEREVFFRINTDSGKRILRIKPPLVWLSEKKPIAPEKITSFSAILRKYVQGGKIKSVTQLNSERVIKITVSRKDADYFLYIELFGTGNVILTDSHDHILLPLEKQEWKDRTVDTGQEYSLPLTKLDTFNVSEKDFVDAITKFNAAISKTLAVDFSLGGTYAEDLCLLANIDKTKEKVNEKEAKKLYLALHKLLTTEFDARIVYENKEIIDIVPFEIHKYTDKKQTKFESYNAALDSELSKDVEEAPVINVEEKYSEKISKIKNIVQIQQDSLLKNEKRVSELQKKGEVIYEKYQELEKLVEEIKKFKEKFGWKNIRQKFPKIKKVDEKEGEVTIDL